MAICLNKQNKLIMKHNRLKPLSVKEKMTIQLLLGCFLAIVGVILLFVSFFVPPTGVIDASVLAAIGEVFTFSGALIGIDYSYKYKSIKYISGYNRGIDDARQEIDMQDEQNE